MATSVNPPLSLRRSETQIDWESPTCARRTFGRRFANAFLANEWRSDMSFKMELDGQTFPAHSVIVACASPVLERCCFAFATGDLIEAAEVTVPEYCTAKIFQIVLRYLYTGDTADELDESNVATVLKVADYFELCELLDECVGYIESKLSSENVCSIFSTLHKVDIELSEKCMRYMQSHMLEIIKNETLFDMDDTALSLLLKQDEMTIDGDVHLVKPMIKWADAECKSESKEVSVVNRRKVLESRLHLIRFGTMTLNEFLANSKLFGDGFFSDRELAQTVLQIYDRQEQLSKELLKKPTSATNNQGKTGLFGSGAPVFNAHDIPLGFGSTGFGSAVFHGPPLVTTVNCATPAPSADTSLSSSVPAPFPIVTPSRPVAAAGDPPPFSSIARIPILAHVEYKTPLETMYGRIRSNDFILDVSAMRQPFTLLELKLYGVNSKMKVLNVFTNESVPHKNICPASATIKFNEGVVPNKNGRIHLRLSMANGDSFDGYTMMKNQATIAKHPVCEHSLSCVESMKYKSREWTQEDRKKFDLTTK